MERGCILQTQHSLHHQTIPLAIQLKKSQQQNDCASTPLTMYNKELKEKMKEQRNLYFRSQNMIAVIVVFQWRAHCWSVGASVLGSCSRFPLQQTPSVCCWNRRLYPQSVIDVLDTSLCPHPHSAAVQVSASLMGFPSKWKLTASLTNPAVH